MEHCLQGASEGVWESTEIGLAIWTRTKNNLSERARGEDAGKEGGGIDLVRI